MDQDFFAETVAFIRELYGTENIPLHRPLFEGNEIEYVTECIKSNFVSSVGARVNQFEKQVQVFTESPFAIAVVNGTTALQVALQAAGVKAEEEVISQSLTFVATCNAIRYVNAHPIFVDVDLDTLGMSPTALSKFLDQHAEIVDGETRNMTTGRRISACLPMHTFGLPCRIEEIAAICRSWNIPLIEDAAEALGSYEGNKHVGTFGEFAVFSFNGNKIITTGGGGIVTTKDPELAAQMKHLTTTAKVPHPYEFVHDQLGYNFRMPNLNAALGCAQMELLPEMLRIKQLVAERYSDFFESIGVRFVTARSGSRSNYWLNAIILDSRKERDAFLRYTNDLGLMTRPVWKLMTNLPMFRDCQTDGLANSRWLVSRVVNIPSSVPENVMHSDNGW
ncbi:LegC family aminotransferase [Gammaproteobacteria bacterium]|nr:LegC family aminotransferase [Gammaproteobacteria bacterium]